jgi:hypothetical protein
LEGVDPENRNFWGPEIAIGKEVPFRPKKKPYQIVYTTSPNAIKKTGACCSQQAMLQAAGKMARDYFLMLSKRLKKAGLLVSFCAIHGAYLHSAPSPTTLNISKLLPYDT